MPIYTDALVMLKNDADISGGSKAHWPSLNVDFGKIQVGSEHAWIDNVLPIRPDLEISLLIDNRIVAFHGHGGTDPYNAGALLSYHWLGFQRMMAPVPHMRIWHQSWKDGGFRIGYKKLDSFQKLPDDQKALVLCMGMQALLENADDYCRFVDGVDVHGSALFQKESIQRMLTSYV